MFPELRCIGLSGQVQEHHRGAREPSGPFSEDFGAWPSRSGADPETPMPLN